MDGKRKPQGSVKGKGILGTTKSDLTYNEGNGKAGDESASTSNTNTAFNDLSAAEKNEIRLNQMEYQKPNSSSVQDGDVDMQKVSSFPNDSKLNFNESQASGIEKYGTTMEMGGGAQGEQMSQGTLIEGNKLDKVEVMDPEKKFMEENGANSANGDTFDFEDD